MTDAAQVVERVFREEYGRVFASLVRAFGDFDVAEEAIQDAFLVAIDRWHLSGVPENPAAWITGHRREQVRADKYAALADPAAAGNRSDPR
jgi:RNA polymerase sigma-70 factor (ECF subfamily)